jgi:DNA-binding transcriptional MerR regulator
MPYKEKEVDKMYYSIGEVAEMYKLSVSNIRFWENEFDVLRPRKNSKGDRLFTKKDLETLGLIVHLVKEKGYTLDGAKKVLNVKKDKVETRLEVIASLEKLRHILAEIRDNLGEMKSEN